MMIFSKIKKGFFFIIVLIALAQYNTLCKKDHSRELSDREVRLKVDKALTKLKEIKMTTSNHPWEIMHGIYLFGNDFSIQNKKTGKTINALTNVCCIETAREFVKVEKGGPLFVSAVGHVEADTHRNMFLSILASRNIPLYHQFHARDGNIYPLWRFLDKAMVEIDLKSIAKSKNAIYGNYGNELGWTLSSFSTYLPLDHKWQNKKKRMVSIEQIMSLSVKRPPGWGICFGTHELYGIAAAVSRRELTKKVLVGGWRKGRIYLNTAVKRLKENENKDGSISPLWHVKKERPKSSRELIYATGHSLEWLVPALSREELRQQWVYRMVDILAEKIISDFDQIRIYHSISTHAGHALIEYKRKALQDD